MRRMYDNHAPLRAEFSVGGRDDHECFHGHTGRYAGIAQVRERCALHARRWHSAQWPRSYLFRSNPSHPRDRRRMPFGNPSKDSVPAVRRSALGMVGFDRQLPLEIRSANTVYVELLSARSRDPHPRRLGYWPGSSSPVGKPGLHGSGLANTYNRALHVDEPAQHQSLRPGAAPLRLRNRNHWNHSVSTPPPTPSHQDPGAAKATLHRPTASVADATRTALPLQPLEC